ncbi:MAG: PEP-CTERM sorting domain-containing protein, partial [Planctomycetota bacterium]
LKVARAGTKDALLSALVLTTLPNHEFPAPIFIDANDVGAPPGPKWNTIAQADVGTALLLSDENGDFTGITATLVNGPGTWNNETAPGVWQQQIGAYAGTILEEGTNDYMHIQPAGSAATLILANLQDDRQYRLEMSASLDYANVGQYVTLNGEYAIGWDSSTPFNAQTDGFQSGTVLVWDYMSPINGELVLELARVGGANAVLNALVLTTIAPEPTAGLLLVIGLGCLVLGRRSRGR